MDAALPAEATQAAATQVFTADREPGEQGDTSQSDSLDNSPPRERHSVAQCSPRRMRDDADSTAAAVADEEEEEGCTWSSTPTASASSTSPSAIPATTSLMNVQRRMEEFRALTIQPSAQSIREATGVLRAQQDTIDLLVKEVKQLDAERGHADLTYGQVRSHLSVAGQHLSTVRAQLNQLRAQSEHATARQQVLCAECELLAVQLGHLRAHHHSDPATRSAERIVSSSFSSSSSSSSSSCAHLSNASTANTAGLVRAWLSFTALLLIGILVFV
jgi:hypothetical protein